MVCPSYREAEPGFDKIWVNCATPRRPEQRALGERIDIPPG